MRVTRVHVERPLAAGIDIELPESAANHLARVLRLDVGDSCVLFNGDGHDYPARLAEVGKRVVRVAVAAGVAIDNESPLRLILLQGVARGEKMDLILQKATELGIRRIVPVISERTEVKLDAERTGRRLAHWQAVIAGACEQSGRSILPVLDAPLRLANWAAALGDDPGLRLALDPDGDASPRTLPAFSAAYVVVGPEGGLSDHDLGLLDQAGFSGLRLGPRILRTETAGLAALSALQALHGDF